jgi:high-affinity iron transporter
VLTYRNSVSTGLVKLVADTDRLKSLVDSGKSEAAKAQWLAAHLDYESLGAAYDTFGPFDAEIDGRPNGLPGGVHDPHFTGFLRVEYGLWHNQSLAAVKSSVATLDADVHGLQAAFPHQIMLDTDLPLRAHEILENALQFELTGETDQGSNTNLATLSANIQGTQTTVAALGPILGPRDPQLLTSVTAGLAGLQKLVDRYRMPDGWWAPVQSLNTSQHEQLDGAVGSLLEQLSMIPGSLRLFSVGAD